MRDLWQKVPFGIVRRSAHERFEASQATLLPRLRQNIPERECIENGTFFAVAMLLICTSKSGITNCCKHLNSSTHRGRNVVCPFCKAALTSASGLSHHLETGSCPRAGNLDHRTMFQAISQRDCSGLVTNKLLTCPSSGTQDIATGATWNGFNYECYLCHRECSTLQGLNQHLSSLAHSEKLYHCPNRDCTGQFVRLASLFNHLESESCNFVRFEKVQKHVHDFITGRQKLISFG